MTLAHESSYRDLPSQPGPAAPPARPDPAPDGPGLDGRLTVVVRHVDPSTATVRVAGEVDVLTAPRLAAALAEAHGLLAPPEPGDALEPSGSSSEGPRARVICDLTEVDLLAAAGLTVLVDAAGHAAARNAELVVIVGTRPVRRAMSSSGFDAHLPTGLRLVDPAAPPTPPPAASGAASSDSPPDPLHPRTAAVIADASPAHRRDLVDLLVDNLGRAAAPLTRPRLLRERDRTLKEILDGALDAVPAATHTGLVVLEDSGRIATPGPTCELLARLDQAQAVLREGPSLTAHDLNRANVPGRRRAVPSTVATARGGIPRQNKSPEDSTVWVDDMHDADDGGRWPRFAPEAVRNKVTSMLCVPLPSGRSGGGNAVLNFYSARPRAFDRPARAAAALYTQHAAIALYAAEQVADLTQALATRDEIGQAKGILMQRHQLTAHEAFTRLVDASQAANIKVRDVAHWLVTETTATGPDGRPATNSPTTSTETRTEAVSTRFPPTTSSAPPGR